MIVALAVIVAGAAFFASKKIGIADSEVQQGIAWLDREETLDAGTAEQTIAEEKQKRIEDQRQKYQEELENSGTKIWKEFNNYAILGDFRVSGFSYYGFLSSDRVFYTNAGTVREVAYSFLNSLKSLDPTNIYLCYGLNDGVSGQWASADDYAKEYLEIIRKVQEELPGANIVVSACPDVGDPIKESGSYDQIASYNRAVQDICEQNGITYVDNSDLTTVHKDLISSDGLHFEQDFYAYWAQTLLMGTYDAEAAKSQAEDLAKGQAADSLVGSAADGSNGSGQDTDSASQDNNESAGEELVTSSSGS